MLGFRDAGHPFAAIIGHTPMGSWQAHVVWTGLPERVLLWEQFDDDYLIYNARSGETHFLNASAAEILKVLQTGPMDLPSMVAELQSVFDTEDEHALVQHISRVIQEFDHAGLICPLPT